MPQFIVMFVIVATMLIEWTGESGLLPKAVTFAPELGGALAVLYVILEGRKTRYSQVRGIYWLVFGAFLLHLTLGLMVNDVEPGAIITGLRYFFRSIPLFLLPAVYAFSAGQIRKQLFLVVALCLLQVPVAFYQLLFTDATGDGISGTLLSTSVTSPFLIGAASVLTAFRLTGRMGTLQYLILLILFVVPTTINETKATLFLLPISLTAVWVLGSPPGKRVKNTFVAVGLSALLLVGFITVYSTLQAGFQSRGEGTIDIFTFFSSGDVDKYLETRAGIGAGEYEVGRVDAIKVPFHFVARDPVTLWFGVGMGNASRSPLGPEYQGRYALLFANFMSYTAVQLLLETGLGGLLTGLLLVWLIFRDSQFVAARSTISLDKALATGWLGVCVLMLILMFYADTIAYSSVAFLFWYFSGLVAAKRMRMTLGEAESVAPTVRTA